MIILIRKIENGWLYEYDKELEDKGTVFKSLDECCDKLKTDLKTSKADSMEIEF